MRNKSYLFALESPRESGGFFVLRFSKNPITIPLVMNNVVLEVSQRDANKKTNAVRSSGRIPAVYYGKGKKNMHLEVENNKFKKMFSSAGENTVIDLSIDGKKTPVLIHEVQYDPISDAVSHVDFIHVNMDQEVTTTVKVTIVGIALAVKDMGGILDVQKHEIKIRCLPKDLIHTIEVDVTPIVDFRTSVHVKDLKLPSTIKILDNMEDTVVTATPPRAEEVEVKPAEVAPVEGAAGATSAAGAAPVAGAPVAGATPAAGKEAKK